MTDRYTRAFLFLLFVAAVLLTAGLGLRDPWPADEPRFALIARDMAEGGNWLIPTIGGDLYPDKPPLLFWLVAALTILTGSLQVSFLLPGVIAGIGTLALVTDLSRRLWGPKIAIWCGATLLALMQFPLQMKSGQIDGLLCLFTTLGVYGLCRHLLLGPDWRWYAIGGLAAGLGVITKGVGFLPFLILIPWAFAARSGWNVYRSSARDWRWLLAPVAFLLPILAWLVPMLIAAGIDPHVAAYRDEILFHQTITRYAESWGHIKPPWYLLTNAVPWLWLPASFLLPWLLPRWRKDWEHRNAATMILGAWVLLVLLFFSLSSGKRSLYIFPAAPAFAMIVGLHAEQLVRKAGVRRLLVAIPVILALAVGGASIYALANPHKLDSWISDAWVVARLSGALLAVSLVMMMVIAFCRRRLALWGYAGSMLAMWLGVSVFVAPVIDGARSGADLVGALEAKTTTTEQVAFVAWPEQFLLQWHRPVAHFGFRRDPDDELDDAIRWLEEAPNRRIFLPGSTAARCFDDHSVVQVGSAHRRDWVLAERSGILPDCQAGDAGPSQVVYYSPPEYRKDAILQATGSGADAAGNAYSSPGAGR